MLGNPAAGESCCPRVPSFAGLAISDLLSPVCRLSPSLLWVSTRKGGVLHGCEPRNSTASGGLCLACPASLPAHPPTRYLLALPYKVCTNDASTYDRSMLASTVSVPPARVRSTSFARQLR